MAASRLRHVPTVVGLWVLVAYLYLVSRVALELSTPWLVAVTASLAAPIGIMLFRRRRLLRAAARRVYLHPRSRAHRWFRGGALMLAGRLVLAVALSVLLLVGMVRVEAHAPWLVLAAVVPLWVLSHRLIATRVARHVAPGLQRLVTDRLNAAAHGALLLVGLVVWSLFVPVPRLDGVSIEAAVLEFAARAQAHSALLQIGLDASAALDGVRHWLAQNLGRELPSTGWRLLVWTLVLLREWLVVWPLLLLLQAIHATLERDRNDRLEADDGHDLAANNVNV